MNNSIVHLKLSTLSLIQNVGFEDNDFSITPCREQNMFSNEIRRKQYSKSSRAMNSKFTSDRLKESIPTSIIATMILFIVLNSPSVVQIFFGDSRETQQASSSSNSYYKDYNKKPLNKNHGQKHYHRRRNLYVHVDGETVSSRSNHSDKMKQLQQQNESILIENFSGSINAQVDSFLKSTTSITSTSVVSLASSSFQKDNANGTRIESQGQLAYSGIEGTFNSGHTAGDSETDVMGKIDNDYIENVLAKEVTAMKIRLTPKELVTVERNSNSSNSRTVVLSRQFIHLHHMKTAGTSIDHLIDCARHRLEHQQQQNHLNKIGALVPYYNVHECDEYKYNECIGLYDEQEGQENNHEHITATTMMNKCQRGIYNAAIMSYCAPLKDLQSKFGWTTTNKQTQISIDDKMSKIVKSTPETPIHAITVFRHPVARVWSMYRFATNDCYKCLPLKEVYKRMDNPSNKARMDHNNDDGNEHSIDDDDSEIMFDDSNLCMNQLRNHMTRNVLLSERPNFYNMSNNGKTDNNDIDEAANEIIQEAIDNMKSFFTVVGLTEEFDTTVKIIRKVFPWLEEEYGDDGITCPASVHENSSPTNNRCGPNGTHMMLPDKPPDEETVSLIIKHNQMDLKLYEAAVHQFHIQKMALNIL